MGIDIAVERAAMAEKKRKEEQEDAEARRKEILAAEKLAKSQEKEKYDREVAEINRKMANTPKHETNSTPPRTPTLDCRACRTDKSMTATTVPRFGNGIRLIGYIIVIPSVIGLFLCSLIVAGAIYSGDFSIYAAGILIALIFAATSLVFGLVGYLLLSMKKVFHCITCGFILDRA